jgi:hypothetical protein
MIRTFMFVPLVAWVAYSQTKPLDELKFSFNGAGVAIHTESSAAQSPVSTSGAVAMGNDSTAYRIVVDHDNRPLFAYELDLHKGPLNTVRVTIRPADQEKLRALDWLKGKVTGDVPTIAAVRAFPPLRLGDEVHVDIMYNPRTGEKLSDVLRIAPEAQQPAAKSEKAFTGPQFSWEGVKVSINGNIAADESGHWMIGEAIMMRVPGHGEYYMALRPPAGFPFQPSGWADHNVLRFRIDGDQVEVTGKSNLLMKSDTGTVWIYHVPEARARGRADSVDITCSGDVDLLMHPERQKEN